MCKCWGFAFLLTFFFSSHGLQPFKVYNLQKLKQNTNKNISLTTSESQILINSSILPVAAEVHPPCLSFLQEQTKARHRDLAAACCAGAVRRGPAATVTRGGFWLYRVSIWNDTTVDRDLDTRNNSDTHRDPLCSQILTLGLLTGSRAKTDAWFFSALLFPFWLAGSREEQGLECEPFRGGLKGFPSGSCFAGGGLAAAAFPGEVGLGHTWSIGRALPGPVCWSGGERQRCRQQGHAWSILIISLWHRSAPGQRNRGGGFSPTRTQTRLTEPKVLCPSRYRQLPGSVGGQGTEPGAGGQPGHSLEHPATRHSTATPAVSLGSRAGAIQQLSESTSASGSKGQAKQSPPGLSSPIPEPRRETKPPRSRSRGCSRSAAAPGCRTWHAQEAAARWQCLAGRGTQGDKAGTQMYRHSRATLRSLAWQEQGREPGEETGADPIAHGSAVGLPRFQTGTVPHPSRLHPKTLRGNAKQRGERPPCCTHTGKARGKSARRRGLA